MAFVVMLSSSEPVNLIQSAMGELGAVTEFQEGKYLRVGFPGTGSSGWLGVTEDARIKSDYDPSVINGIEVRLGEIRFFVVEGRDGSERYSSRFILAFPGKVAALIDDTNGQVVSMEEAKRIVQEDPTWPALSD